MQLVLETAKPSSRAPRERWAKARWDSFTPQQETWALRTLACPWHWVRGGPAVDRSALRVHGVGR
jgi:hypothetical protein